MVKKVDANKAIIKTGRPVVRGSSLQYNRRKVQIRIK